MRTFLKTSAARAYEACGGKKAYKNDAERMAFLFELYQRLMGLLGCGKAGKQGKRES